MANGTLKVQNIETSSGSGTITLGQSGETIALGASSVSGFGKIGQVQSSSKTDTFTTTSSSFTDITDVSVNITPTSTLSKILIQVSFQFGTNSGNGYPQFRMLRDSTVINAGATAGSRSLGMLSMNIYNADTASGVLFANVFVDSPASTSQITYKIQARQSAGNTVYVGSNSGDSNAATSLRSASNIVAMEILP